MPNLDWQKLALRCNVVSGQVVRVMSNVIEPTGTAALPRSEHKCHVPAAVDSENCLPVVQFILKTVFYLYSLL